MTPLKTQLFEELGKLNVMHTEANMLDELYQLKLDKCDKQAKKVQDLTNQYICEYGTYPDFL